MNAIKQESGVIELALSKDELGWFGQTLNECCNGFGVKDFKGTIGADEQVLRRMLDQIGNMYEAPIGHEG